MIKINLATRKTSVGVGGESGSGGGGDGGSIAGFTLSRNLNFGSGESVDSSVQIRRLVVLAAFYFGSDYAVTYFNDTELARVNELSQQAQSEQNKLRDAFGKTKAYVELKKVLDEDEKTLRTKLDTIELLLNDRTTPPKLLLALSRAIPNEVWLTEFKLKEQDVSIRGSAVGFNAISDFMKNLNEYAYFKDLNLKDTQQEKEKEGEVAVANFELSAQRVSHQ